MDIDEINSFLDFEYERIKKLYGKTDKELTYPMMCKIVEEVGELSGEVLSLNSYQRKDKLHDNHEEDVKKELADVLLTTLLLSRNLGINPFLAIENKSKIIKERKY